MQPPIGASSNLQLADLPQALATIVWLSNQKRTIALILFAAPVAKHILSGELRQRLATVDIAANHNLSDNLRIFFLGCGRGALSLFLLRVVVLDHRVDQWLVHIPGVPA